MNHYFVYYLLKHERLAQLRGQAMARETAATWPVRAMPRRRRRILGQLPDAQLLYLFASSFIILFVGMGLFPVLPVYAAEFGATRTVIGLYYALMYAANAAGAMLTNRLAARLTHKGLFVAVGALGTVYALSAAGENVAEQLAPMLGASWSVATARTIPSRRSPTASARCWS